MSTPIGIIWTLLTIMVAGIINFSFLQPFWFVDGMTLNAIGMYSYCIQDIRLKEFTRICGIYGGHFQFSSLPSSAWQATVVLFGGGCALLALSAMLAIIAMFVPSRNKRDKRLSVVTGYLQILAVIILVAGLIVFPLGLESKFVQHYCEGARSYSAGACQVGWAYILGIMGTALAVFCPFLSHYTDMKVHTPAHV